MAMAGLTKDPPSPLVNFELFLPAFSEVADQSELIVMLIFKSRIFYSDLSLIFTYMFHSILNIVLVFTQPYSKYFFLPMCLSMFQTLLIV